MLKSYHLEKKIDQISLAKILKNKINESKKN